LLIGRAAAGVDNLLGEQARATASRMAAVERGAVAFSETGDPQLGEWHYAVILGRYGDVPDDLAPLHVGLAGRRGSPADGRARCLPLG
jgi:hypothetical protein